MAAGSQVQDVLYQRGEDDDSDAWDDTALIKAYDDAVSVVKAKLAEQIPEYSSSQVNLTKAKKKKNKSKPKKKHKGSSKVPQRSEWTVGDECAAVYVEDGEIYQACILAINDKKQTCIIRYVDYGNEEEKKLSELLSLEYLSCQDPMQMIDTASDTETSSQVSHTQETQAKKPKNKRKTQAGQGRSKQVPTSQWPFPAPPPPPPNFGMMPPPPPPFPQFQSSGFPGGHASGPSMPAPPMFPCIPPPPPIYTNQASGDENEALYSMLISWYMSGYHTGYYQGLKQSTGNLAGSAQGLHR